MQCNSTRVNNVSVAEHRRHIAGSLLSNTCLTHLQSMKTQIWQGAPLHGADCPHFAQAVRSCSQCTSPCLKVFIARLVADTPRKPARAQMPKLMAQKIPNVYPAPTTGLSQILRIHRFPSQTVCPTTSYRQLQESRSARVNTASCSLQ